MAKMEISIKVTNIDELKELHSELEAVMEKIKNFQVNIQVGENP